MGSAALKVSDQKEKPSPQVEAILNRIETMKKHLEMDLQRLTNVKKLILQASDIRVPERYRKDLDDDFVKRITPKLDSYEQHLQELDTISDSIL